ADRWVPAFAGTTIWREHCGFSSWAGRPLPTGSQAFDRGSAMPEPAAHLDEIRALLAHLPGPDLEAGTAAALRERQLTKPAGALGRLEELTAWLATWQGRHPPRLDHPR